MLETLEHGERWETLNSEELTVAVDAWQGASERFLEYAAINTEVAVDAAGGGTSTTEEEQAEALADDLIRAGDAVLARLDVAPASEQVSEQYAALFAGTFGVSNDVLDRAESEVVADGLPADDAVVTLQGFAEAVKGVAPVEDGPAVDAIPEAVKTEFEQIEDAAGKEVWELVGSSAVKAAGPLVIDGLDQLLDGALGEAFDAVRSFLGGTFQWAKRAVTKVVRWIAENIVSRLPEALADQVTNAWEQLVDQLSDNAGSLIGSGLGVALGRPTEQKRWDEAEAKGYDLTAALAKVPAATDGGLKRIAWVTTGRKFVKRFEKIVLSLAGSTPQAQVAYGCLVGASFLFVAWQLEDGIDDIGALAPTA